MHTVYERGREISAQTCHQIYHMAILDDNLPITNILTSRQEVAWDLRLNPEIFPEIPGSHLVSPVYTYSFTYPVSCLQLYNYHSMVGWPTVRPRGGYTYTALFPANTSRFTSRQITFGKSIILGTNHLRLTDAQGSWHFVYLPSSLYLGIAIWKARFLRFRRVIIHMPILLL